MKKLFATLLLLFAFANVALAQKDVDEGLTTARNKEPKPIQGQFIVILKEEVAKPVVSEKRAPVQDRAKKEEATRSARTKNISAIQSVVETSRISKSNVVAEFGDVLVGFAAKLNDEQVKTLRSNKSVAGVYQDYEVETSVVGIDFDPCMEEMSYLNQTTTCAVTNAGGPVDGSGKATWIWILDTGIDLDHPDLNVQASSPFAKSFISGETINDGDGHGTHVAGIAAARNNGFGVVGVSAGARVVPVKVLDNTGSGSFSGIISGLNHVAQYDIPGDVVNMSIQSYGWNNCENANPTLRDAVRNLGNAGTFVVIAAGNSGACANRDLPGCINGNKVYTVGSITCQNTCSGFSNFGAAPIDWVAVGSNVYSTFKGGGYATMSGTSMAAPVVAGIIHARNGAPVSAGSITCGNQCAPNQVYQRARR
ncbi:MAG TPA: S8 family serine peptidase [Chitinophagales bacterium]|nr:S8 family serine peptidase [Chitinophagales bacterium]HRK28519.1 S8 family serine peptidase [Chitinophagales bacterium]